MVISTILAYLRWMQDAATTHSVTQGRPFERYLELRVGTLRFHEYLRHDVDVDRLKRYTWVSQTGSLSSPRSYRIASVRDNAIVTNAETLWIFINFNTGNPTRVPETVKSAFFIVTDNDEELPSLTAKPSQHTP